MTWGNGSSPQNKMAKKDIDDKKSEMARKMPHLKSDNFEKRRKMMGRKSTSEMFK